MENDPTTWLLLLHQLPNSPAYLRVKMWRRLQKIGAVPVKNGAYVLPNSEQSLEDLHWLATEIMEMAATLRCARRPLSRELRIAT